MLNSEWMLSGRMSGEGRQWETNFWKVEAVGFKLQRPPADIPVVGPPVVKSYCSKRSPSDFLSFDGHGSLVSTEAQAHDRKQSYLNSGIRGQP